MRHIHLALILVSVTAFACYQTLKSRSQDEPDAKVITDSENHEAPQEVLADTEVKSITAIQESPSSDQLEMPLPADNEKVAYLKVSPRKDAFPKLDAAKFLVRSVMGEKADTLSTEEIAHVIKRFGVNPRGKRFWYLSDIPLSQLQPGDGIWLNRNKPDGNQFLHKFPIYRSGRYLFQFGRYFPSGNLNELSKDLPFCFLDIRAVPNRKTALFDESSPLEVTDAGIYEHKERLAMVEVAVKVKFDTAGRYTDFFIDKISCSILPGPNVPADLTTILFSHFLVTIGVGGRLISWK